MSYSGCSTGQQWSLSSTTTLTLLLEQSWTSAAHLRTQDGIPVTNPVSFIFLKTSISLSSCLDHYFTAEDKAGQTAYFTDTSLP